MKENQIKKKIRKNTSHFKKTLMWHKNDIILFCHATQQVYIMVSSLTNDKKLLIFFVVYKYFWYNIFFWSFFILSICWIGFCIIKKYTKKIGCRSLEWCNMNTLLFFFLLYLYFLSLSYVSKNFIQKYDLLHCTWI